MEFEEIKKVWDTQNNEPIYGINQVAMHNRILTKQKQGLHITNISELLGIIAYTVAGIVVLVVNIHRQSANVFIYILSLWMLASAIYILVSRIRRINTDKRFDRSMHGDLTHAISVATYQVRFSQIIRWNSIPIGVCIFLAMWHAGKSIWIIVGTIIFLVLTIYASGWEHNIYKKKKRELKLLKEKLNSE